MIKKLSQIIISFAIILCAGGSVFAAIVPQTAFADGSGDKCTQSFLGFPAWYRGLLDGDCSVKSPADSGGLSNFIWHIALNVLDIGLMAAGYIAAFFIIYGGFLYMISQGNAQNTAKALSTILNAVIGLVLSIASVAIVNFIVTRIMG